MWKRRLAPYVIALVSVGLATLVALPIYPDDGDFPPLLLLVAVALTASFGGFWPAALATSLGFLSLDYFFEQPEWSLAISALGTSLDLVAFVLVAVLLGVLNARLRHARERANEARTEAEVALHSRDEALAIVSHDLRTPLTAIKTSVSTLRNPGMPLADSTRGELLSTIEAEADRLVHFVGDALAMSRLESGITPDPQWNALGEIVAAVLDRSTPILADRPVSFDVPDTLPLARFDAGLLDQVLSNVIENVGMHTPSGTPVSIVGRVENGTVRVEVSDGGPGIPREARERIFAKFERLGDHGVGTGLGLAIARAAATAQGGDVLIDDSPLGGARFVVLVPNLPGGGSSNAS
ncbi:MAG: PAS domain-containing sensor histidine kinase [Chloroflexi bacterium]|nr:PAS domain-containing sensor histidine kinase [Chloroflexota bacterium]